MDYSRVIVVLVLSTISDHEPFLKQIVFVSGILVPLINTIFVFALLTFALFLAAVIIVLCMKWPSFRTRRSRGTDRINDAFVLYSIEDAESLDRALALYFGNDYIPSTLEHMILYGDSNISDAPCVREALVSVRRSRVAIIVVTRHFIEALRAALIGIELHCHILRKALARETKYAQYDHNVPDFDVLVEENLKMCGRCSKLIIIADSSLPNKDLQMVQLALEYFLDESNCFPSL